MEEIKFLAIGVFHFVSFKFMRSSFSKEADVGRQVELYTSVRVINAIVNFCLELNDVKK